MNAANNPHCVVRNTPALLWSASFEGAFDSSWGLFQTLLTMNAGLRRALVRDLFSKTAAEETAPAKVRNALTCDVFMPMLAELNAPSLLDARCHRGWQWTPTAPRVGGGVYLPAVPFYDQILRRTLAYYAGPMVDYLADYRHARFCEACVKVGYFSVFHQLSALVRCPIHGCKLRESCPRCSRPTVPFRFTIDAIAKPFRCCCGWRPNTGEAQVFVKSAAFKKVERSTMAPLAQWVMDVRDLRLDLAKEMTELYDQGKSHKEALHEVFSLIANLCESPGNAENYVKRRDVHSVRLPMPPPRISLPAIHKCGESEAFYRSVRRHIEKRLIGARAPQILRRIGEMEIHPMARIVVPDANACLLSQAYVLWCLRTKGGPHWFTRGRSKWQYMDHSYGFVRLTELWPMYGEDSTADFLGYAALGLYYRTVAALVRWRRQCLERKVTDSGMEWRRQVDLATDPQLVRDFSFAPRTFGRGFVAIFRQIGSSQHVRCGFLPDVHSVDEARQLRNASAHQPGINGCERVDWRVTRAANGYGLKLGRADPRRLRH